MQSLKRKSFGLKEKVVEGEGLKRVGAGGGRLEGKWEMERVTDTIRN